MNSPEGTFQNPRSDSPALNDDARSDARAAFEESTLDSQNEREDASDDAKRMMEQAREAADVAAQYVRNKPLLSLGIAVAVGVVAGLLAKRSH